MNTTATSASGFDGAYRAWMARIDLTPEGAARVIGVARSVSYSYASGASAPTGTRMPFLAGVMGIPEAELRALAELTRGRIQKAKKNAARNVARRLDQKQKVVHSHRDRTHAATLRRGRQ